jgi:tryptophan-rich sensory protein
MPPFTPKSVTCFLLWIVIFAAAVLAGIWMIWHATGRQQIQPRPNTALVLPAHIHTPGARRGI